MGRYTTVSYHQMIEARILSDRHCELIDGDVIDMSPELPEHYNTQSHQEKMREYLENGARLGGLIDPQNRRV